MLEYRAADVSRLLKNLVTGRLAIGADSSMPLLLQLFASAPPSDVPHRPEASWRRRRLHPRPPCLHHLHVRAIRRLRARRAASQRSAQFCHQRHQRRRQGDVQTAPKGCSETAICHVLNEFKLFFQKRGKEFGVLSFWLANTCRLRHCLKQYSGDEVNRFRVAHHTCSYVRGWTNRDPVSV